MFNRIRARRKGVLLFTAVAALLTGLVGYLLMHRLQTDSVHTVQHSIDAWRMTLTLMRWALISLVAFNWNQLIAGLARMGVVNRAKVAELTKLRGRAVTWLVVVELVLGQGVLVKAVGLVVGAD